MHLSSRVNSQCMAAQSQHGPAGEVELHFAFCRGFLLNGALTNASRLRSNLAGSHFSKDHSTGLSILIHALRRG